MNRRAFLKSAALATAAPGLFMGFEQVDKGVAGPADVAKKMQRIGCTTFSFKKRFPQTRPAGHPASAADLDLLKVPEFFAEHLGVHNVELWSRHFGETSETYCEKVRAAAKRMNSKIINIQLDEPGYNLSHTDPAVRKKSVEFVKQWMDRAAACGAPSLRANIGGGEKNKFDLKITSDSFRQLADYGRSLGVKILIENHGGHSADPDNIVAIVKAVGSPWCRTLPDFGNMPAKYTMDQRTGFLKKLLPYAHLISAKGVFLDQKLEPQLYNIGAFVRSVEAFGFKGIYSAEQWSLKPSLADDLGKTKRIIELLLENI